MGNLSSAAAHYHSSSSAAASPNPGSPLSDHGHDPNHMPVGYISDDPAAHVSTNRRGERKKGVPWTEEEHRLFLVGLQKLGKGDWRGIARTYVMSRTPTQVASHAQKYFNRQSNLTRRKRRSSLFDMIPDDVATDTPTVPEEQVLLPSLQIEEADNVAQESARGTKEAMVGLSGFTPMVHTFFPPYVPVSYPFWPTNPAPPDEEKGIEASQHQVLKPIPLLPKESVNVDDLLGMSKLRIEGTENVHREPSQLSLKLPGEPSRQSAFHANGPPGGADLSNGKSGSIQAVLH